MRLLPKVFITCLLSFCVLSANAQTDYYKQIKNIDLSKLWRSDSLFVIEHNYGDEQKLLITNPHNVGFPEPLGFIDTNCQRFDIHFISVTRSPNDPYKYLVTGKTRTKDVVTSFRGTISIKKASLLKTQEFPMFQRGIVTGEYKFFEDSSKATSGFLAGQFQTAWYLNSEVLFYDILDMEADGYRNNQFTGTWTGYKKKKAKKCNWGDYRIPGSKDLDIGVNEFSLKDRYIKNGWQNYATAHWTSGDTTLQNKALAIENEAWWAK